MVALCLLLFGSLSVSGQSSAVSDELADKSAYNLFNPTPVALLRELSTDRPDKTESPYTVDAGHIQLEADFANYTGDHDNGVETDAFNVAPFNFKIGLLNNVDVQIVFDSYIHERVRDRAARTTETTSGVGDLTTRLKINLWGNDGGKTAFAIMPFVKAPTNSHGLGNNAVEGGVILPLAVELPGGFGLGLMTEFDFCATRRIGAITRNSLIPSPSATTSWANSAATWSSSARRARSATRTGSARRTWD